MARLALAAFVLALLMPRLALAFDVGPPVGTVIPELAVKDSTGATRDLASLVGEKGAVLVFHRSAKWCPFCQKQLLELKDAAGEIARRGYGLAAISYDAPAVLEAFAAKHAIPYVLLSDEGSVTIDAFGIRDPQYKEGSFAYGVPRPAIFILARSGVIEGKLAEEGYKTRPPAAAILEAIDTLKRGP